MKVYSLSVISVIKETRDAVTICLKQPSLKKIKYLSGQYITVSVNINGRKYKRPYSLSSSYDTDVTLNITVKRIPHGVVSNYLCDSVKPGQQLEILEPMGEMFFPVHEKVNSKIMLWAAGSGITPLFSILKSILKNYPSINVNLVYVNHDPDSAIYYEELNRLAESNSQQINFFNYFSRYDQPHENVNCYNSRLTVHEIDELLIKPSIENQETLHYICGPKHLKEVIKACLYNKGHKSDNVISEDFDHVLDESQLQDVHTQDVSIHFDDKQFDVTVVRGKSILEAGLDQLIDLPYSCQNGSCKLCLARISQGRLKQITSNVNEFKSEGDSCLLCCSYPITNDVKVIL
jgi:ring-1,2-phenylacetyl-CoA epoxidase subunit PaaE